MHAIKKNHQHSNLLIDKIRGRGGGKRRRPTTEGKKAKIKGKAIAEGGRTNDLDPNMSVGRAGNIKMDPVHHDSKIIERSG